ncbi:hypothetical protein MKW92_002542 [Papaver armeniacum]|nr:hypothetical protein MKW92_002542 [Papaver armeniacum]
MILYLLRGCSAINRIITAKDHASVQLNIGHIDDSGFELDSYGEFLNVHCEVGWLYR